MSVVMCVLLCLWWVAVEAEPREDVLLESFDESIINDHLGPIITSSAVAGLLVVSTILTLIMRKRIRTSLLLIVLVWCAQTLVGLLVWQLTYTSMRDALSEQVEIMLLARTSEVALTVKKTMDAGARMNEAVVEQHNNHLISLNASYPLSINLTHALWRAWNDNEAISYVYYGNKYGYGFGISPVNKRLMIVAPPSEWNLPPEQSMFGADFKCIGTDVIDECDEGQCNTNDTHKDLCGKTCAVMTRASCAGDDPTVAGRAALTYIVDPLDWQVFNDSKPKRGVTYSPMQRPWYTEGMQDHNVWTAPYTFGGGTNLGVSVVHGVRDPSNRTEFLGVFAVDYAISTLNKVIADLPPTKNSMVLLLNVQGNILAGSVDKTLFTNFTGYDDLGRAQFQLAVAWESPSDAVRLPVEALLNRFGNLQNVLDRAEVMLLHEGRRIIAVRRAVMEGGLETLVVIVVPYEDVLQKGEDASTEALFLTVVISVLSSLLIGGLVMVLMRPLHTLIGAVHDVAHMRLEGMELDLCGSYLREVAVMSEAMRVLMQNMREYKSFLPEAIFNDNLERSSSYVDREPPGATEGRAAVVFTDIVGSTRLWEGSYDGMHKALQQHNEVIRDAIREVNGYEVKTIGDSFMVAFDTAEEGLRFGLRVQEGMAGQEWPESILDVSPDGVVVRIGVNFGTVAVEHNELVGRSDYHGPTVNRAARLEGCCRPGEVALLQDVFAEMSTPPSEIHLTKIDRMELRGVVQPMAVVMVVPVQLKKHEPPNPLSKGDSFESAFSVQTADPSKRKMRRKASLANLINISDTLKKAVATLGHIMMCISNTSHEAEVTRDANVGFTKIVVALEITGGKSLTVAGSAGIVGWNATKQCASHVESAFRFVGLLTKSSHDKVHCGLSSGKILTGYVGTRGQRYITAVGPAMRQCIHLSCQAEVLDVPSLYTTHDAMRNQLCAGGFLRPVAEERVCEEAIVLFEMNVEKLQRWCHSKGTSLLEHDAEEGSAANLKTSWTDTYAAAFFRRDEEAVRAVVECDPSPVLMKAFHNMLSLRDMGSHSPPGTRTTMTPTTSPVPVPVPAPVPVPVPVPVPSNTPPPAAGATPPAPAPTPTPVTPPAPVSNPPE